MKVPVSTVAVFAALALAVSCSPGRDAGVLPYRDARLPTRERVRDLLARMTLEEKFWQLYMIPGDLDDPALDYSRGIFGLQISETPRGSGEGEAGRRKAPLDVARRHAERINAIQRYFVEKTRLGIPIIPFEEALHGLARAGATQFPQAIGLAATWDPFLMARVAAASANETRSRGIRQALSPVVNIASDVRWGRVEETYGEDPYLSTVMGVAFVQAFERAGVVATPKHFVANVGDGGRDSYPIEISERALVERFFPPFEAAVRQARARSVMTAYNSVDGTPATQNRHLMTEVLKRRWGFGGFVISDAAATGGATVLHMTEPDTPAAAAHAWRSGLDVVFQTSHPQHAPYLEAVRRGLVPVDVVDAAVTRVLTAKFELGLFERPYVDPEEAAAVNGRAEHAALAREAARASIVLLKNDRGLLPLSPAIRSVAVIGVDAEEARLGGYSGPGIAKVSVLDGFRQALGPATAVRYAPGPGRGARDFVTVPASALGSDDGGKTVPGLRGEYFDNNALEGKPTLVRSDARIDFGWTLYSPDPGIPFDWYSVRWTGRLTAPANGVRSLGVEGNDGYRLYLDGALLIDDWKKQSYGSRLVPVALRPGSTHDLRLEFFESTGNARVKLVWDAGAPNDRDRDQAVAAAAALARQSDVAVVVAGLEEGEFRDRASLALPGRQDDLILAVAAAGKPVVVVLVGGSAVTMSRWIDRVGAIVEAWYPGEQGGHAVADVLLGKANPAGRLPISFPVAEGQLPLFYNHKPTGRGDDYLDLTGQPLFPFGFGLSYTTFSYSTLRIEPGVITPSGKAIVRCAVRNTGTMAGDEVVQLYLRDELASVARPVTELAGFTRVHLEPGESAEVTFEIGPDRLRMLDEQMRWVVEPGAFRVMVGASSKDIRLRGQLAVR